MTLVKKKFYSTTPNVYKVLWGIIIIVIILTTSFMLKYLREAIHLMNWRYETNDIVTLPLSNMYPNLRNNGNNNNRENNFTITTLRPGVVPTTTSHDQNQSSTEKPKPCKPVPPKDDFSKCGNRVSEWKCYEYIWAWKYKDDLLEYAKCITEDQGIAGGTNAGRYQFPHMVAIGYRRKNESNAYDYHCGGTLISEQFVLSAAHCTNLGYKSDKHEREPEVVAMGSPHILNEMKTYRIVDKYKHVKYKSPKYYYDVALFKLLYEVEFTYDVHPACLSTVLDPYSQYSSVNITGWGAMNDRDKKMADRLQVATVEMISIAECKPRVRHVYAKRNFNGLQDHQFCAGMLTERIDTCQGDSGGPLQVRINTKYGNIHQVIGVTSFGKGCASKNPSIYVNVASVLDWIEDIIWPNNVRTVNNSPGSTNCMEKFGFI